jgi:hypothetical protein
MNQTSSATVLILHGNTLAEIEKKRTSFFHNQIPFYPRIIPIGKPCDKKNIQEQLLHSGELIFEEPEIDSLGIILPLQRDKTQSLLPFSQGELPIHPYFPWLSLRLTLDKSDFIADFKNNDNNFTPSISFRRCQIGLLQLSWNNQNHFSWTVTDTSWIIL